MSGRQLQVEALKDAGVPIAAIALRSGYVIMEGGLKLPIVTWYDELDDETDEYDDVVRIDAGSDETGYLTIPIEPPPLLGEWDH